MQETNINFASSPNPPEEKKAKNKKILIFLIGFIVFFFVGAVILAFFITQNSKQASKRLAAESDEAQTKQEIVREIKEENINQEALLKFAKYVDENSSFNPSLPEYTIAVNELNNLADFEAANQKKFSNSLLNYLSENHFVITKNNDKFYGDDPTQITSRNDDWGKLYSEIAGSRNENYRKPENAVYISSDSVLHFYHRLIENEFEYIEVLNFYPNLKKLTDQMFEASIKNHNLAKNQEDQESYKRIIAYFAIPKAILDTAYSDFEKEIYTDTQSDSSDLITQKLEALKDQIPQESFELAKAELALILDKSKVEKSPIFGPFLDEAKINYPSDYTQYAPRSHYNKNAILRSYFRAMMWYGRNYFALKSQPLTRDAINIVYLMDEIDSYELWDSIYQPTAFFVGVSDDLGIYDYASTLNKISDNSKIENLDSQFINRAVEKLKELKDPKIMSSVAIGEKVLQMTGEELRLETKGLRFMGQRFTPDAFIMNQLSDPSQNMPTNSTALLVMNVFGNQTAAPLAEQWIDEQIKDAPNKDEIKETMNEKINELKNEFENTSKEDWTQNIYWSWIYTLKALNNEDKDKQGYPVFMQKDDWNKKNLQCSLGSWTELKHDTLLYAKQSYAEMGGGGDEDMETPPVPKGYVEPNIEFFDRLIALNKMTVEGLSNRGLIDDELRFKNDELIKYLEFFRSIAIKQLQNETITDEEFERLRVTAINFDSLLNPLLADEVTENGARSALVADVHTDVPNFQILYEATGIPNYIYVAVKDKNGARLTKGLVFSYYEFNEKIEERINDEQWREKIYKNQDEIPEMPEWEAQLIKY
ncbi:MAG: DUF3160 domain-containing protein [Candidatus Moranbacteria bacterium]|nr:DUF3160 domain-containing protein [Candidatus Moranbacteria bacterium]